MRAPQGLAAALLLAALPLASAGAEAPYALTKLEFLNANGTPKAPPSALLAELQTAIEKKPAAVSGKTPFDHWLNEDVAYLITDSERADAASLKTDEARDVFVEKFWQRRNPAPDSSDNGFKTEHYRRIAYANERFADASPGWKTARGRAYIVAGPPDEVEAHPERGAEIWRYHDVGEGMQLLLTFGPAK